MTLGCVTLVMNGLLLLLSSCTVSAFIKGRQEPSLSDSRNENSINSAVGVSRYLYQGDIAITKAQYDEITGNRRGKRSVVRNRMARKWKMPVPFTFDDNFPYNERPAIHDAMKFWSEKTCVAFQENPNARQRINIVRSEGCWSFVGRQPMRVQPLSLEPSCTNHKFVIAHELAHTLGVFHEHARSDRDKYIDVDFSNLDPKMSYSFLKEEQRQIDDLNTRYEYGSVMHYAVDQFARNPRKPVMYPKLPDFAQTMGNRMRASFQDISRMNDLYDCHYICRNTVNRCYMGGYPNPRDCSTCVCPDGFGGDFCELPEPASIGQKSNPSCGGILWATSKPASMFGAVRTRVHSNNFLSEPEFCFWHIRAPKGRKIKLTIDKIVTPCSMSCTFNALELKLGDFGLTGKRFCCDEHIYQHDGRPKVFETDEHYAVIGAYARYDYLEFDISYYAV